MHTVKCFVWRFQSTTKGSRKSLSTTRFNKLLLCEDLDLLLLARISPQPEYLSLDKHLKKRSSWPKDLIWHMVSNGSSGARCSSSTSTWSLIRFWRSLSKRTIWHLKTGTFPLQRSCYTLSLQTPSDRVETVMNVWGTAWDRSRSLHTAKYNPSHFSWL